MMSEIELDLECVNFMLCHGFKNVSTLIQSLNLKHSLYFVAHCVALIPSINSLFTESSIASALKAPFKNICHLDPYRITPTFFIYFISATNPQGCYYLMHPIDNSGLSQ